MGAGSVTEPWTVVKPALPSKDAAVSGLDVIVVVLHAEEADAPTAAVVLPATQAMQAVAPPVGEKKPAGQEAQAEAPATLEYLPAAQGEHVVVPYWPALQEPLEVQPVAPAAEVAPAAQVVQEIDPVPDAKVPDTQVVHVAALAIDEKVPAAQLAQVEPDKNWPAAQLVLAVQPVAPAAEVVSAAQVAHDTDPVTAE